jgi:DNA integrity scanning protein DisA with diadenylate cyclase activity
MDNSLKKPSLWQRIFKRPPQQKIDRSAYHRRRAALRDGVAVVFLSFLCFLAIFQKMETLAITSMVFVGVIIFKHRVLMFITIILELLNKTKIAKVGDLELTVEQKEKDFSKTLKQQDEWVRVVLADLTSEQIGMLIVISKTGVYKIKAREKDSLRILRAHGLVFHNAPTMTESTEVWLSEFGKEIAERLVSAPHKLMVSDDTLKREAG